MKKRFTMMVVGGARSGKSRVARAVAERSFSAPLYLATAEITDCEMQARIDLHKKERDERWRCVEEPLDVAGALMGAADCDGILLDCVTVWLGNVMHHQGMDGFEARKRDLLAALRDCPVSIVVVSNELGQGLVPADAESRLFRDLAGWLNQDIARTVDAVVSVSCGIPIVLKGKEITDGIGGVE